MSEPQPIEISALYKFVRLAEYETLREPIQALCDTNRVKGIILLAREGINGTIAGTHSGIAAVLAGLRILDGLQDLDWKTSFSSHMPFLRMKVRLKTEIVTIGDPSIDPTEIVGTYVNPQDWNALISDPDVIVIDTRNTYETRIGTFQGSIDPKTRTFSEFPGFIGETFNPEKHKKVAMFCTGGIRCEKASSFMKKVGFENVYHLKGGILKYLEHVEQEKSLWTGACFVFDERVAVGHGLEVQDYSLCFGCCEPLTADERIHDDFELGVSCPHCAPHLTDFQKTSARERQKQIRLAKMRGKAHIGPKAKHRF